MDEDVRNIKELLKPAHIILKTTGKLFHHENNSLLGTGVTVGLDFLLKKILLRNAGWISRLVLPFFIKNATNNLLSAQGEKIIDWTKNFFRRMKDKNHHPIFDKATADTNY
jgi:hypothetical protein